MRDNKWFFGIKLLNLIVNNMKRKTMNYSLNIIFGQYCNRLLDFFRHCFNFCSIFFSLIFSMFFFILHRYIAYLCCWSRHWNFKFCFYFIYLIPVGFLSSVFCYGLYLITNVIQYRLAKAFDQKN